MVLSRNGGGGTQTDHRGFRQSTDQKPALMVLQSTQRAAVRQSTVLKISYQGRSPRERRGSAGKRRPGAAAALAGERPAAVAGLSLSWYVTAGCGCRRDPIQR